MQKRAVVLPVGTIRMKKDGKVYEKNASGWKISKKIFPGAHEAVKLFKAHKNLNALVDKKDPGFLKGMFIKGEAKGARINVLPDGKVLEKAFSLFSHGLKIHDQNSHDHWDVIYQNKGGTYSYVYTVEKRRLHRQSKYKKVEVFAKHYPILRHNVEKALHDKNDPLALPMETLLTTYMRVGNETYYKAHGHKGLTTLMKKDVSISGNKVKFNYLGKDGVPQKIAKEFPLPYVQRLKERLQRCKNNDFIFSRNGHPLPEKELKKAFVKYCGQEFYPHIVRSFYATSQVRLFLHENKKFSKNDVTKLFLDIAGSLGHKKFNKKTNSWEENYAVTVQSYIQPELAQRVFDAVR